MADYAEHYLEIRNTNASVVAISVDAPEASEALRVSLSLPFPILCDTERCVVKQWNIYNSREKGGIARPSVFIIDQDRVVRYSAVDTVIKRVMADQIVCLLKETVEAPQARRRVLAPSLSHWLSAVKNAIHR